MALVPLSPGKMNDLGNSGTLSPIKKGNGKKENSKRNVDDDTPRQFSEEECVEIIGRLVLDLSLVTALPVGPQGKDIIRASAAANSLAYYTSAMGKAELRNFKWTVQPLLDILIVDVESPLTSKSALALKTLVHSRICMKTIIECNGLLKIAGVMDVLLSKRQPDLKLKNYVHDSVENLAYCYQEFARFFPWEIVNVGALRHCVVLLKHGEVMLQTLAALTLSSLSNDQEITKQMFSYGAIKPLLVVSNAETTNDACMLAGLGCITQLCRIPEIAQRMVQQGAVPVLEFALHRHIGHNNLSIREKALYSLGYLAQIPSVRPLVATDNMLLGIKHEFLHGTIHAKTTILQILMNLHNHYPTERQMKIDVRDEIMNLLQYSAWKTKNLCLKVLCVVFQDNEDREYFVEKGIIDCIINVITTKDQELQEVPLVSILHLSVHEDIPWKFLYKGIVKIITKLLYAEDVIIRELAVIVLKTYLLYNSYEVERAVPEEKKYMLRRDVYNPQNFGKEYGGMIYDYLQLIVENRREADYLIRQFTEEEIQESGLTREELTYYQNLFMEIDAECLGYLGEDELKMLVVLKGERLDKEEILELIRKYDLDKSGTLEFKEFVRMMKEWDKEFGKGLKRFFRESVKRGAIGKSVKAINRWMNKNNIIKGQVEQAKELRIQEQERIAELQMKFLPNEKFFSARDKSIKMREYGLNYHEGYGMVLPPIKPSVDKNG